MNRKKLLTLIASSLLATSTAHATVVLIAAGSIDGNYWEQRGQVFDL